DHGGPNGDGDSPFVDNQSIDFGANVLILSGRNPELIVGDTGVIDKAINLSVNDVAGGMPTRTSGQIVDNTIRVNNIANVDPGQVFFTTGGTGSGSISGSGGTWEFRDTF